ncbi:MAG: mechanosensitive ion channel [Actinobacteria bacterium]|nr:mechanosensitive ion channel [Actinomycetota bacterium]
MIVVPASLVGSMLDQVGAFIPRLVAALVLLIIGIIVARVVSKAARRGLTAAGLDRMADNWGVHDATERVGLGRSLSATVAAVVRAIILFVTVLVAVSLLGVPALEQSMNEAILFLPRLVVALVILMLGLVAGNSARDRVDRLSRQMDLGAGPGVATMIGVLAIAVIIAATQVGIPTMFLIALAITVLAGVVLTAALAIGLGARGVVAQLAAGRYLGDGIAKGRRLTVGDVEGEVVQQEGSGVVIRTDDGRLVRIPNRRLLESIVEVDDIPGPDPEEATPAEAPPEPGMDAGAAPEPAPDIADDTQDGDSTAPTSPY